MSLFTLALQQQPSGAVIVKLVEPHQPDVADVLIGALGVTGALVVVALLIGVLLGGTLFWVRSRRL